SLDDLLGGIVATHGVDGDRQHQRFFLAVITAPMRALITAKRTGPSDFEGLAAAIPAAVGADDVGQLGLAALGADAAGRLGEAPGGRPPAAALGLGGLLLGDGHCSFLTQVEVVEGGPAGVVSGGRTVARSLVEIGPAGGADALTSRRAERGQG